MATRRQLRDLGWSESAVRHHLASSWQLVYPRVVAPHLRPVEGRERLVAATLWAGPKAVLSGRAGLALLGLEESRAVERVSFLVPDTARSKRHADAQTYRSDRVFSTYRVHDSIPVTTPARCLVDAACWEVPAAHEQTALTIALLQQGLTRPAEVHRELRLARRNHTRGVTEGVQAFERGAWSRPEGILGQLLDASDVLPHVCLNPKLVLPDGSVRIPDGYVREVALAIQVHSRTHHARDDDWERTVEGDAALTRAGILVSGVTPRTLYVSGDQFVVQVERTYQALLGRPLPELSIHSRCC